MLGEQTRSGRLVGLGIGRRVQGCFNGDYVWPSEPFKDGFRPLRNPRSYHSRLGFAYQVAFVRLFDRFPQQQPFELIEELVCFSAAQLRLDARLIELYRKRQPDDLRASTDHHRLSEAPRVR